MKGDVGRTVLTRHPVGRVGQVDVAALGVSLGGLRVRHVKVHAVE